MSYLRTSQRTGRAGCLEDAGGEPDKNPCDYIPQMLYVKESIQREAFPDRGTLCKDEGVNT